MVDESLIAFVSVLACFLTPVLITGMALRYRLKRKVAEAVSKEEIEALRREIADLRVDMHSRFADLTLMIDDAMSHALPGAAKRQLNDATGEEDG